MTDHKCKVQSLSIKPETSEKINDYASELGFSNSGLVNRILDEIFIKYSKKELKQIFKPQGNLTFPERIKPTS